MCGCDFGNRIKGIGPKRSLDLIQKFKTIEDIELNNDTLDIECLNHNICRKLLTPCITDLKDDLDVLNIKSEEYDIDLDKYNSKGEFEILFSRTRNFPLAEDVPKN
jgi:5'-3' exonuclease